MRQEDVLLYVRGASKAQVRVCLLIATLLLLAFLATLPLGHRELRHFNAFIPVIDTLLFVGDGVIAILLFTQASILRSRALIALGTGYLFSAILIVPHALTMPGIVTPTGFLGAGVSTAAWLYVFWHAGLPLAGIAYALLRSSSHEDLAHGPASGKILIACVFALAMSLLITLLTTLGHDLLPAIMTSPSGPVRNRITIAAILLSLAMILAMALVWRGPRSLLDLWLMVTFWGWLLELQLNLFSTPARFSLAWYSGRTTAMLSSMFVLLALLTESGRLYKQMALSAIVEQRQREGRLMSLDAVAAAIAHEVKQPIAAIVTNAGAALLRLERPQPDLDQVARTLRMIIDNGHRAGDVIGSVRAMFGRGAAARTAFDINALIGETLELLSIEFEARKVSIVRRLDLALPGIVADRVQLQQLFLNLFANALEAMAVSGREPILTLSTELAADGSISIAISDTGHGIDEADIERIFDAFFTTKPDGTGMGLALCRSIAEAHGGSLLATPAPGSGATFHVNLPVDADD